MNGLLRRVLPKGAPRFWLAVAVLLALTATALSILGVPSAFLFAGVVAGGVCALCSPTPRRLPAVADGLAFGIVGVVAGSMLDRSVVEFAIDRPLATLGSTAATLAITVLVGQLLRISPHVHGTTATFASIAGGASGLTALAREVHADDAVVVSVQYLRVLVVVLTVPVVAPLLGEHEGGAGAAAGSGGWSGLPFTAAALIGGLALARVFRFSASRLVFPLVLAAGLAASGWMQSTEVPGPVQAFGFATIGLMVGLQLSRSTLRRITSLLPLVLIMLAVSSVGCALVGVALARATGVSMLSAYLATTPGGLPAVTAVAVDSGENVGLVLTCQIIRLFMALLLGSIAVAYIARRRRAGASAGSLECD